MSEKLKLAKQQMGSAGRESAEMQRQRQRIVRERSGIQAENVRQIPNAEMKMPSEKRMMQEGRMDLANKPNPTFGKEMAMEKVRQQKQFEDFDKYREYRKRK